MRLALAVALALGSAVLARASQDTPPFRAATRLVVLQATVRNARGQPVTDLDRSAFSVYENGTRQSIDVFRREDVPVSIGLLIDNSGSMRTRRATVEAAALAFARASNPMDELFVVNFADKVQLDVPFTSDRAALERGITRADAVGGTALWDAVASAQTYLRGGTRPRRVLVVITDGNDNASEATRSKVVRNAQQQDTVIDAVGLFGTGAKEARGRRELDELARATGGTALYPMADDQINATMLDLAREIRNQYLIAYTPLNARLDGTYRTIRVTASRRANERLTVLTRPGYRAAAAGTGSQGINE